MVSLSNYKCFFCSKSNFLSNLTTMKNFLLATVLVSLFSLSCLAQVDTIADNLYEFNENIGIGINEPDFKLRIEDDVADGSSRSLIRLRNTNTGVRSLVSIVLESSDKTSVSTFGHTSSNYTGIPDFQEMGYLGSFAKGLSLYSFSDYGSLRFHTNSTFQGFPIERMRINSVGSIGIGTKSPDVKLRIEQNVPTGSDRGILKLRNTNSGNRSSVHAAFESYDQTSQSAIGHTSSTYTGIPDFDQMGWISSNAKGFSIYSSSDYGSLRFYINQNEDGIIERMRINSEGNIGVGTKDPLHQLHLKSANLERPSKIYLENTGSGSSIAQKPQGGEINLNSPTSGKQVKLSTFADSYLNSGQNFGLGTSTPNSKLEVASGDVYISDINKGVIMKSPNGSCWRGTVNNSGQLSFQETTCPESSQDLASSSN